MIELRPAILRIASIAAACCLLPATGGWAAARETPSRFESYLVLGYGEVSAIADRNGEADLAKHFLARAKLAVAGQPIAPETPAGSSLSVWTMHEASLAREQFLARLEGGAREDQPLLAAIAQVNFDCWVAPLHVRIGVPDGDECRRRFYFAFAGLRLPAPPERGQSYAVEFAAAGGAAAKASRNAEPACLGGPVRLDCPPISFTGVAADNLIRLLRGFASSDAPALEDAHSSAQAPGGEQDGDISSRGSSGTASSTASSSGSASTGGGSTGGSVSGGLGGTLSDASDTVGKTVGDAAGTVGSTVGDASGAIGGTVDAVGDTVGGAVGSTGTAVGGAVSGVGRAGGSLLK
jgi:hypothetical protein